MPRRRDIKRGSTIISEFTYLFPIQAYKKVNPISFRADSHIDLDRKDWFDMQYTQRNVLLGEDSNSLMIEIGL